MKWKIFSKTLTSNNKEILKILLANRGLKTKKEVEEFLNPIEPEDFIAKDLGIDAKEVVRAVKRINEAIVNNEGIIVYGDYDGRDLCHRDFMGNFV